MDLSRGKSQLEVASRQSERLVGVNAPASLFSLCKFVRLFLFFVFTFFPSFANLILDISSWVTFKS